MKRIRNILICPLEWGLGHAGRMIPLAAKLREAGNNIFIGAGNEIMSFFLHELPGLTYIDFPGFRPGYSKFLPQYLILLLKTPVLLFHIFREHSRLKKIIHEYGIDIVISDNRFGLWNKKVRTVYVTHMPLIPFPRCFSFLEFIGIVLHRAVINRYSLCFIPDLPGELNLTGRLSHGIRLPQNTRYIGILSRFTGMVTSNAGGHSGHDHYTIILSGPEPQREILKQKLTAVMDASRIETVVLEGKPGKPSETSVKDSIRFFSHLVSNEMREVITGSRGVVARAGYTSIMELISLNCCALLIPTPGQTEQEYLAGYLSGKGWFAVVPQNRINTDMIIPPVAPVWPAEIISRSRILLDEALAELSEDHQE
ncbi:MAG: hypothetical protein IQL11_01360 [Bacteroidales bacterium]|nr:hypothetical protein [Bacteroidales bacterium]